MQAWLIRKPAPITTRPLTLENVPVPAADSDEILVRVRACALCRTDLHVVEGELPVRLSPIIPGHQIVGTIEALGHQVSGFKLGERVGIAWLHRACGHCRFCRSSRENLCEQPLFTGWSAQGGYAEFATVPAAFAYKLPDAFDDVQAAPLLCAGIVGARALGLTGVGDKPEHWRGVRLGIYGFGAAAHVALQIVRARGAEVYVFTRDRSKHQPLAAELGAVWVGDNTSEAPVKLDAAIIYAPAGELVPVALRALDRGGKLVLGGIRMSTIPALDYSLLYEERCICSVANATREDGRSFLEEAAAAGVRTQVETFAFGQLNEALGALKHGAIRGAGVLLAPG